MLFTLSSKLVREGKTVGYRFTSEDGWYVDLGVDEFRKFSESTGGDTFTYQAEPNITIKYAVRQISVKEIKPFGDDLWLTADEITAKKDGLLRRRRCGETFLYMCEEGLTNKESDLLWSIANDISKHVKANGLAGRPIDTYYPIEVKIKASEKCAQFKVRCHNDYDEDHSNWYIAEPAEDILNKLYHGEVAIGISAGDKKWFYISVYRGENWDNYCKSH